MIHVCFCFHDKTGRYAKFAGTAMLSLFENTNSEVTVHTLHDNTLTADNRDKFIYLAGQYNQRVKFYNVEILCADKISEFKRLIPGLEYSWSTIGAFFKCLIAKVVPQEIEKIIYLDSDIIVNLDVKNLWEIELEDKILGAVSESINDVNVYEMFLIVSEGRVKAEDYFNAGVLFMNLKLLRTQDDLILSGIKFRGENPQHRFWDQTVWNYCFSTKTLKLPIKFNRFAYNAGLKNNKVIEKSIYHYVPKPQALSLNMNFALNRLWMHYFLKTPWFDEDTIGRLYASVQNLHVGLKQSMVNLTSIMSGKTRAFFVSPNDIEGLKQFFAIRNDEKIIPADGQDALQRLLDLMKKSRGKRVFFIMLSNFPFQILLEAGFAFGIDFVNGLEFLSEAQGFLLDSHRLIKEM